MEIRKNSEWNLIPPTPPCMDCKRKRMNSECYKWCDPWNEYAEKYQAFVRKRDEVKKLRVREA